MGSGQRSPTSKPSLHSVIALLCSNLLCLSNPTSPLKASPANPGPFHPEASGLSFPTRQVPQPPSLTLTAVPGLLPHRKRDMCSVKSVVCGKLLCNNRELTRLLSDSHIRKETSGDFSFFSTQTPEPSGVDPHMKERHIP